MKYPIAISTEADGTTTVRVPDVSGCIVTAPTLEEAIRRTRPVVAMRLRSLASKGQPTPSPKSIEEHKSAETLGASVEWDTLEVYATNDFSPRDFMRARRPELYSDSSKDREPLVDATYLAFALAQVTERKDEVPFEHFCRKLAEKEICPNLIPQTGPTGGGDSKVDSETYPVSEFIADRWYIGEPERSSKERWAFAISAKRDWRSKVKDDVHKVAKTGRHYSMVYFFTNQQVPDRQRGEVEDELRKKWDIDVRIFDRNWIAEKVLQHGHYELFESTFQIHMASTVTLKLGPEDVQRDRTLAELDRQIADPARYRRAPYELAEDSLETALLARGLERPRTEVDGRFDRAERAARETENDRLLLRITYHRAWTAVCWYEDYDELDRLYEVAASLALGKDNVWDLEKIAILWQLGTGWRRTQGIQPNGTDWGTRTEALRDALGAICEAEAKPTSALMAQTLLAMMSMIEESSHEAISSGLLEITAILETAQHQLDYPFDSIARVVEELVNMAGGNRDLDTPLEKIIEIQAKRGGELQEGKIRLQRAFACLEAKRHVETIRQAGKAQVLLGYGGDDKAFVKSILLTAYAYEAMGLLWAARANYTFALHWILKDVETKGKVPSALYIPLPRLIWIEIQLGRVPQVLCWAELHGALLNAVDLTESQIDRLEEQFVLMDAVLAIMVLRTQWSDLSKLDCSPSVLEALGFDTSSLAAMFLLGYEEIVASESGLEDPEEFFTTLLCQPAARDIAEHAEWGLRWPFKLETTLFGCRIYVLVNGGLQSLLLAEGMLAFMESFLATSGWAQGQLSYRGELRIKVVVQDDSRLPFEFEIMEDDVGEVSIIVRHRNQSIRQVDQPYIDGMIKLFAQILSQLWVRISESHLESLFAEERAQDRGMLAANLPVAFNALLGESAKVEGAIWMRCASGSFALRRTTQWSAPVSDASAQFNPDERDSTESRIQSFGVDAARHRDTKVLSLLNMPLWDAAGWKGMVYLFGPRDIVPEMYFSFENIEAGRKIIRGWIRKFGQTDPNDTIGLTLVTGIDRLNPHWYKLVVSHKDAVEMHFETPYVGLVARYQEMTPNDDFNLRQFLKSYQRMGRYRIAALEHRPARSHVQISRQEMYIEKRLLKIVPAWKIGPNDFLRVALTDTADPVIPPNEKDPPFHRTPTRPIDLQDCNRK